MKTNRRGARSTAEQAELPEQPPRVARIQHQTLQERVYQQLRNAFLRSQFSPGETLTIRGLAEITGTSVQPVRDALQRLSAEKALEWLPNTAFRVPAIDRERYRELWEIRALLEGRAVELAAANVSDMDLAKLRKINKDMRAAMRQGDAVATLAGNRDFHFTVYEAAKSPTLVSLIEMIWIQVSPLFATFTKRALGEDSSGGVQLVELAEKFFHLQDAVIEALSEHDGKRAAETIREILASSAMAFSVVAENSSPKKQGRKKK